MRFELFSSHQYRIKYTNNFFSKLVVDVTTLKPARKPVKLKKKNPVGCAGEGRQSKEN